MTDTLSPQLRRRRLINATLVCLLSSTLVGCDDKNAPNLGATASNDPVPAVDLSARGPAVRGNYGNLTGNARAQAEVFNGTAPATTETTGASGSDDRVRTADANGDIVPAGNGSFQLNFENADVGAVSKAILGDILKSNYLVDKRVAGQITLTSSQPVPRARLVPLLESALAGLGATVVKDQDLYRVVPSADPGGIGAVDSHGEGEGFGTSVITSKYMPSANLAHLLEGFGSRPGSVKSDPGTNLVIIQGTASERRAALDAAGLVDVDWLRSKSVAILPVSNSSPDTVIGEVNHILDSGEGGMTQGPSSFNR